MLQRDVSPSLLLQIESLYVLIVGTPPEGTGVVIAVRLRLKHAADMTSLKVRRTVCMQEHGMVTSIISTHRIPTWLPGFHCSPGPGLCHSDGIHADVQPGVP